MAPAERGTADAWERTVERLFRPGTFIPERACSAFVSDLKELRAEFNQDQAGQPERVIARYELLLAACYEKSNEADDSCSHLGMFVESLFCGWVRARQAALADPGQTATWLLARMDEDPHGYCLHLEREVAKALGEPERAAFRRGIEDRAGAGEDGRLKTPESAPRRWVEALRNVYLAGGQLDAYTALAESTGLSARDCQEIAEMLMARDRLTEALVWMERGLALEKKAGGGYGLDRLRRSLLVKLGRADEALQSAWAEFMAFPHRYTYEHLSELIPEAERQAWREQALEVVGGAPLQERMELLMLLQAPDQLASLVDQTPDPALEGLSHTLGEPVAALLEGGYPGLAARLWRARALRILHTKRSKYYEVAVLDLAHARDGFLAAGEKELWDQTVTQLRVEHRRKLGFMEAFERLVAGATPEPEPTFLERARARWRKGWNP
jgi:hypothetical protein